MGLASVTGASAWGYGIYNSMDDIWGFMSRVFGAAVQSAPRIKDTTAETLEALLESKLSQRSTPPVTIVHSGGEGGPPCPESAHEDFVARFPPLEGVTPVSPAARSPLRPFRRLRPVSQAGAPAR